MLLLELSHQSCLLIEGNQEHHRYVIADRSDQKGKPILLLELLTALGYPVCLLFEKKTICPLIFASNIYA